MIKLPDFKPSTSERKWIDNHRSSSRHLQRLWRAAPGSLRRDPGFIEVLLRATWVGTHNHTDQTRLTRNRYLAAWLGVDPGNDQNLAERLVFKMPALSVKRAQEFIAQWTGLTLYYSSARPATITLIRKEIRIVAAALERVSGTTDDVDAKVSDVADMITSLPRVKMPTGGKVSPFSGLSPLLAALDPHGRFPIINKQTQKLVAALGATTEHAAVVAMSRLVGERNLPDNHSVDVFANSRRDAIAASIRRDVRKRIPAVHTLQLQLLGEKSEQRAYAMLRRRRIKIRRLHNALTNKFLNAVQWRYKPQQSRCDIVLGGWRGRRFLLIEAKTGTSGLGGRTQLRQAIGQLFDYRRLQFPNASSQVDLALLTPSRPDDDVLELLRGLDIEALWFERNQLCGTIDLFA
jgi:hypothetical protein